MIKTSILPYMGLISVALVAILGCHADTPSANPVPATRHMELLKQLTDPDESERFKAQPPAMKLLPDISLADFEAVLTSLRQKNVSTLIYVCIKTKNNVLYRLSPPAKMAVENAAGAFPNIAYFYARVKPEAGLEELLKMYHRFPGNRLPICLALGEMKQPEACEFLLAQARKIKMEGESAISHLHGLHGKAGNLVGEEVFWLLEHHLGREEIIALADLRVPMTEAQIRSYWRSGTVKQSFVLESVLGEPEQYYDSLRWIVSQYIESGDYPKIRQMMLSDHMRSVTSPRIKRYRELILKKIGDPKTSSREN